MARPSLRTVRLASGGWVTLEVNVPDLFGLTPVDRTLIFGLVGRLRDELVQRLARRRRRNAEVVAASDLGGEA